MQAHSLIERMHDIDLLSLDAQSLAEVAKIALLCHLCGPLGVHIIRCTPSVYDLLEIKNRKNLQI